MSPSLADPAQAQRPGRADLLAALGSVPDPRDPRGVRHALPVILAVAITALLAAARSFTAIGEWVGDHDEATMAVLSADKADGPSESAIRRLLTRVDADRLDAVIGAGVDADPNLWSWTSGRLSPWTARPCAAPAAVGVHTTWPRTWSRSSTTLLVPSWGRSPWPPRATRSPLSVLFWVPSTWPARW